MKHWPRKRLKYCVDLINEKVEGDFPRDEYVGLENIVSGKGEIIPSADPIVAEGVACRFRAGDVLFNKLRPYLAKVVLAPRNGYCTSELLVLRPRLLDRRFTFYSLLNPDFIALVNSSTYGSKMPRANWEFIGNQLQAIPPLREQHAIAAFLDRKTTEIDQLIAGYGASTTARCGSLVRMIELLSEYRQTLISAAVTGKIDVQHVEEPAHAR